MRLFILSLIIVFTSISQVSAINIQEAIGKLVPKDKLPRTLNTLDIPDQNPNNPEPVLAQKGDFNGDGMEDAVIAGAYTLPGDKPFFLLVATMRTRPVKYETLFFAEYVRPPVVHLPGTTGAADPKNQAFSISFCSECDNGFDFYWHKKTKKFEAKPWEPKIIRIEKIVTTVEEVPQEIVDACLKVAGEIPDVKLFVADLKKKNKPFGVRVTKNKSGDDVYDVRLFEKKGSDEKLYDVISISTTTRAVTDRQRVK